MSEAHIAEREPSRRRKGFYIAPAITQPGYLNKEQLQRLMREDASGEAANEREAKAPYWARD